MEACFSTIKRGVNPEVSNNEDNSPEYLLPTDPVTDPYSSDDNLGKIKNRKLRAIQIKDYKQMQSLSELKQKYVLCKDQDSCDFKGEWTHFYLSTKFKERGKEVHLEHASLEDCLFHALKFTSDTPLSESDGEFKLKGQTIREIKDHYIQQVNGLSWIIDNDTFNFKMLNAEEKNKLAAFFVQNCSSARVKNPVVLTHANFVYKVFTLFQDVCEYVDDKNDVKLESATAPLPSISSEESNLHRRSDLVKDYLKYLASFLPTYYFLTNGECEADFQFYVQEDDISKGFQYVEDTIDRSVNVIMVKPDGVFVRGINHKYFPLDKAWQLVVEVCDPFSDSVVESESSLHNQPHQIISTHRSNPPVCRGLTRSGSQIEKPFADNALSLGCQRGGSKKHSRGSRGDSSRLKYQENTLGRHIVQQQNNTMGLPPLKKRKRMLDVLSSSSAEKNIPVKQKDSIGNHKYCSDVRKYIKKSLPEQCQTEHMVDTMTGKHVIQLFSQAKQNMRYNENTLNSDGVQVQKAIGWFIVNEYVYFSKLLVEKHLLEYLNYGHINDDRYEQLIREGKIKAKVSYSNFRFDLTIANHRIALVIFLHHKLLER